MIKFAKQQQNVYCNALHHQILQLLSLWYVIFFIDLDTQIKVLPKFIKVKVFIYLTTITELEI